MNPIARASQAKLELRETEEAFRRVREAMVAQLFASPVTAALEREKLYLGVQALDAVREVLARVVDAGEIEAAAAEAVRQGFGVA
jgi:hypothetical protein